MTPENIIERDIRYKLDDINGDYYLLKKDMDKIHSCKVKNISGTGVCIISLDDIKNNEIIFLYIHGNKENAIKSKVVWRMEEQYGLQFVLDSNNDFKSVSYVMNHLAFEINKNNP